MHELQFVSCHLYNNDPFRVFHYDSRSNRNPLCILILHCSIRSISFCRGIFYMYIFYWVLLPVFPWNNLDAWSWQAVLHGKSIRYFLHYFYRLHRYNSNCRFYLLQNIRNKASSSLFWYICIPAAVLVLVINLNFLSF